MEFRPCIDIHNGKVKQIVGGTLSGTAAKENFVAEQDAAFYARFYGSYGIRGGHVILLNGVGTEGYEETKAQALQALKAYPGRLQVGGGITPENAEIFLDAGASHVIVTSYVFREGRIDLERMEKMVRAVGREHLVLDYSCRKKEDGREHGYYIVTDRWSRYTDTVLDVQLLKDSEQYAGEYLIHAVDVEGKASGIETEVARCLGEYEGVPVTYAGGIHSFADLEELAQLGRGHVNATVGSALDLFGGKMVFQEVLEFCRQTEKKV
ncbi:MAG: phosphoribosylformimino-5-aminoimidazole carboxamide ribotide isomerase [Lachnospiraceae bacterium]|nr:phosphoribosylformimino-5-aminoimidazole carboxamide ribotide isomerase [Lachnospiraceae bacterium]